MEKEFDIEVTSENTAKSSNVQLPLNILSFGEIEPDDVKVYIKQDVYKALEKYASSDTSKELGTILIGNYCEELSKTHVIISNYIEAKYTDASASTLTFTHETWEYVHNQHETLYPDQKIIGWQHTHPNYGIFLSNYDLFIQENFFNLPAQIAYVIDPIQNLRGFFQWKNGKIEKLKGYYIYDEVGKPIKIEQKKIEKKSEKSSKSSKILGVLLALLLVATVVLGVFTINLNNKYNQHLKELEAISAQLEEKNQIISTQEENIGVLQSELANLVIENDDATTAQTLIAAIENNEISFDNQDEILSLLKELVNDAASNDNQNEIKFIAYTIQPGDSLSKICNKYQLNYSAVKDIILTLSGITNPNSIYVGQIIILPVQ
ncbi:MAG: LysM peptidoglycan-binding domain-containing protein [Clostridia bacterium]|nr:LysM peptidoglycan-binding domain-containing protein [Clostridia bacterium]